METVTSHDGTSLAVERVGSGPPLVCIHGTSADRHAWDEFATHLDGVECVFYDRRGRGDSGDAGDYSLAREVADARAVVEEVGDPESVSVFGHSFGAAVAFELAREVPLARLALYEPPLLAGDLGSREDGFADHLRTLLDEEGPEAVYRAFHGVPADEETDPDAWADDPPAHTVVREAAAVEAATVPDAVDVSTPTRCLRGGETDAMLRQSTHAVRDALPDADLVVLDGHGHNAVGTAPGLVTDRLDDFLPA